MCAKKDGRPICFLHDARNGSEHAFRPRIRDLASKHHNADAHICYSQPTPQEIDKGFCDSGGRLDIGLVKSILSEFCGDFYLCGPGPFMKSLRNGLLDSGEFATKLRNYSTFLMNVHARVTYGVHFRFGAFLSS